MARENIHCGGRIAIYAGICLCLFELDVGIHGLRAVTVRAVNVRAVTDCQVVSWLARGGTCLFSGMELGVDGVVAWPEDPVEDVRSFDLLREKYSIHAGAGRLQAWGWPPRSPDPHIPTEAVLTSEPGPVLSIADHERHSYLAKHDPAALAHATAMRTGRARDNKRAVEIRNLMSRVGADQAAFAARRAELAASSRWAGINLTAVARKGLELLLRHWQESVSTRLPQTYEVVDTLHSTLALKSGETELLCETVAEPKQTVTLGPAVLSALATPAHSHGPSCPVAMVSAPMPTSLWQHFPPADNAAALMFVTEHQAEMLADSTTLSLIVSLLTVEQAKGDSAVYEIPVTIYGNNDDNAHPRLVQISPQLLPAAMPPRLCQAIYYSAVLPASLERPNEAGGVGTGPEAGYRLFTCSDSDGEGAAIRIALRSAPTVCFGPTGDVGGDIGGGTQQRFLLLAKIEHMAELGPEPLSVTEAAQAWMLSQLHPGAKVLLGRIDPVAGMLVRLEELEIDELLATAERAKGFSVGLYTKFALDSATKGLR